MADRGLGAPLLQSEQPHVIITVDSQVRSVKPINHKHKNNGINNTIANNNHHHGNGTRTQTPFDFLQIDDLPTPNSSTVDPFKNHTPNIDNLYECLKIVICLPLVIVRAVLFGICLLVGFVASKIALQGWKDKQSPMPKWRCRVMWITRICSRCILFSFGYHWIRKKGKPASRETAPIVVSNHLSYIEPIFFFYELFPTIVASESHDAIPFVGTIIRAMQVIYVDRFSPSSRKYAVNEIKRRASCDRFPRVLLFPEGTTTNGRAIISFQLGAFIPGYPVQPVIVRYPHVEYLPVVAPVENQKENAALFAQRTSHAIASALNVVQTSHSYGDLMLLTRAVESKQENVSNFMVEMAKVEQLFHMRAVEAKEFLEKFLSMNPDPSGYVRFHDFLKLLRLRPCPLAEQIFNFIDVERNERITFKQFLVRSAYIRKQPLFRRAYELAFSRCDLAGNGFISKQELRSSIIHAVPDLCDHEIHELFNLFDSDGDGRISRDDFTICLRKNPLLIALFSPILLHNDLTELDSSIEEIV
ncbi:Phospholipid/glycerol acyltransferase [Dillenia turbinata]|uniref:Phospholipid/glycerol acyltransferase n=1 Tax=Dillenia turbinata TaxID=194707 RepID=A0AAN8YX63_9MAGN